MNGFKLLAVIPLNGCNSKFRKNLQVGGLYKFYQNYEIVLNKDKTNVQYVDVKKGEHFEDLYNLKNGIKVNVSAIVGMNGTGKSALIELLYYFIYILGIKKKYNDNPILTKNSSYLLDYYNKMTDDLKELNSTDEKLLTAIKFQNKYKLEINLDNLTNDGYIKKIKKSLENKIVESYSQKESDKNSENKILEGLNVCIVFETNQGIFSGRYFNSEILLECLNPYNNFETLNEFSLENFFYSVCLNFSHHSLNSKTLGNWVNNLFHKNDAYTTPVVINPMRNEGNFNINNELHLSNERLMSNLVYDFINNKDYKLLSKYEVVKIIFRVKKSISPIKQIDSNERINLSPLLLEYSKDGFNELISVNLLKQYLGIDYISRYYPFLDYALGYLENKIPKLKEQYPQLFSDKNGEINEVLFKEFIEEDQSHITKKIRQTLNFIKYTYNSQSNPWSKPTSYLSNHLTLKQFYDWLEICNKNYKSLGPMELMNYALPGFFNVDFELKTVKSSKINLSELSSGEQQIIFNTNSITYHLYNLQSIHQKNIKKNINKRVKYKNISIILDEVELYYHPNMQREIVDNILNSFELIKRKGESGIESINVCFLTHSPFILSDIPSNNILKLTLNNKFESITQQYNSETFGANIHELLSSSFFMKTLIGKFSDKKILELIDNIAKKDNMINEQKLINIIGDSFLKASIEEFKSQQND